MKNECDYLSKNFKAPRVKSAKGSKVSVDAVVQSKQDKKEKML
jgi:hypothetical protein